MATMHVFYFEGHVDHDPGRLHPLSSGQQGYYPEVPARADAIRGALQLAGLGDPVPPLDHGLAPILAVHTPALVELLQRGYDRAAAESGERRPVIPNTFAVGDHMARRSRTVYADLGRHCYDVGSPLFAGTWDAAYGAAQVALSAAADVRRGARVSYALCRPPGHHAAPDIYGGFCYLNNIAIAADWLAKRGHRPAILDVDYHHGNGTQAAFYSRADVFFCSLHGDPAVEYPFYSGFADERGAGAGEGTTLNLPLPLGTVEPAYFRALDRALGAVQAFQGDVLLVSLGFDTVRGDPTGTFGLNADSFTRLGRALARLRLPLVVIQEGGYLVDRLGTLAARFFDGLLTTE